VSNLTAEPQFTSVQLTWGAPEAPNGVITQYEIIYRVQTNITGAATTEFTIQSLMPNTMVSDISVTAFTSAGHGVVATTPDLTTPTTPNYCKWNTQVIMSLCIPTNLAIQLVKLNGTIYTSHIELVTVSIEKSFVNDKLIS
jgi:hypothetical protein